MKSSIPMLVTVAALTLAGCSNMDTTDQRVLSGAAIGTLGGAAIGAVAGDAGAGALIGAGVGAVGGYLYDRNERYNYGY